MNNHPVVSNGLDLDGRTLTLEQVEAVARGRVVVTLEKTARERMEASRRVIAEAIASGKPVYGVTTGFGRLADTVVPPDEQKRLQLNLLRSHAVGVGPPLADDAARAVMVLRANTLAGGHCGVRPAVVEQLLACLNEGVIPRIPALGSVGASGDLAPLAHLGLMLIGEGEARYAAHESGSDWRPAADVLAEVGLGPLELEAKEGLSLVNGTQVMTALGTLAVLGAERLGRTADLAGALTLEGLRGTRCAFRAEIHAERPHVGQTESAARLRDLLGETSEIDASHADCGKVQDAYSLRCMPQVHGAVRDTVRFVRTVLKAELNAATDNPLVFPENEPPYRILSGGNFHGAPIAAAMDFLAIALADLSSISERRIEALVDPTFSGLPAFLADQPGIQSGFMMHQVTAAALVSENKGLAHPASVDSIPTSANKEDHVSMGAWAARKATQVLENAEYVIAIELLAAAQGLDFLRPLRTTTPLESAYARIRTKVDHAAVDRPGHVDIDSVTAMVRSGAFA